MNLSYNATNKDDEVISVSQLNKMAKSVLENNLPIMWIKGEISGLKTYSHLYFDLKDEGAKISCVMFAKLAAMVDFKLENGTKIEVRGRVTLYPQNGSYQINVERVRKVGLGELWEAYNKRILQLREEGLFDAKYKKPLPIFPRRIGVITSKEGAVIRDVVTTLKRRMPSIQIVIYHSAVQGTDASMQIARAIRVANQRNEVDVLIVCRGGGSMEDLWCFNEEVVARETFQSTLPIISAVGHETDTTIIDFVSDLRAPTPTAAAELVTKSANEWLEVINRFEYKLKNNLFQKLNNKYQMLDLYSARLKVLNPYQRFKNQQQEISRLKQKLEHALSRKIDNVTWQLNLLSTKLSGLNINTREIDNKLIQLKSNLSRSMLSYLNDKQSKLNYAKQSLSLLNPNAILKRGYAIIHDGDNKVVQSIKDVRHHSKVQISLSDGRISAVIDKKSSPEQSELI
ncbi:MAG: exodeoxyribonuclease VII large subunit [Burkholderiales bacterium]|nr:exodeoxyribonuclease VII large subunit [Burkholderiales bacterium]